MKNSTGQTFKTIGDRYKHLREEHPKSMSKKGMDLTMNASELASAFSEFGNEPYPRGRVSGIENSTIEPTVRDLKLYHDFFDVPYEFLLGETDSLEKANMKVVEQLGLSDVAIKTIERLKKDNGRKWGNNEGYVKAAINKLPILNTMLSLIDGMLFDTLLLHIAKYIEWRLVEVYSDETGERRQKAMELYSEKTGISINEVAKKVFTEGGSTKDSLYLQSYNDLSLEYNKIDKEIKLEKLSILEKFDKIMEEVIKVEKDKVS